MGGRKRGKDSIGEDIEQLELSNTAVGNVNWYNHFGKLVVSTWAEYMPPRYIPNGNTYICSVKNIYVIGHSGIIDNSPQMETNQTPIKNRMTEQIVLYLHNRIYSNEKRQT